MLRQIGVDGISSLSYDAGAQVVVWLVMDRQLRVGARQLDQLRGLWDRRGDKLADNRRPIQASTLLSQSANMSSAAAPEQQGGGAGGPGAGLVTSPRASVSCVGGSMLAKYMDHLTCAPVL
jgi:hypothetical protein